MTDVELLKLDIEKSGLSVTQYAQLIVLRDPRTVRRWLEGQKAIPPVVMSYLKEKYPNV